jgi:hypothetical protein
VLACASAVHLQSTTDHVLDETFSLGPLFWLGGVVKDVLMEVAVAYVAFNSSLEANVLSLLFAGLDNLGQAT